ncbi:hypothetical protein K469DRAFT_713714 [Zopfia rhizophila CBS 207.26]|uniref:Uncharacterized protein n=1 Tax=Zopfia rhizophila CBS 207.26 TaxID=1314779 RepID=A0A6A6DP16_9PEZI|nr:hypothetical protein K469DRAFT_713714 [Zopfia rhizophila CBS 207.26]
MFCCKALHDAIRRASLGNAETHHQSRNINLNLECWTWLAPCQFAFQSSQARWSQDLFSVVGSSVKVSIYPWVN